MENKEMRIDELLVQYEEQEGQKSSTENAYVAYKKCVDYETCDCAKCCCCLECCG